MRAILFVIMALAISSCGQSANAPRAGTGCQRTATQSVAFSNPAAPDTITARSNGPSCLQAFVSLEIRDSDGDPLWTLASTYYELTAGGVPPGGAPAVSDARMDTFLTGWAKVSMMKSGALPAWREGAPSLAASVQGFSYATDLPRESYEMLRQRDLPLLCYAAAVEATQCLIMDPATGSPTMIVAYGP